MDYFFDDDEIVQKPGLFIHLVMQKGYKMLEYEPPKYQPIFNLTCDIFCHHKENDMPTSCPQCSAKVQFDNLYKDPYMEQFKNPVRMDLEAKKIVYLPMGKGNNHWEPMQEVPEFTVSHLKFMRALEYKEQLTEEQQFELQNFQKYKILPEPKEIISFMTKKDQYSTDFELENEAYFTCSYFPDPIIQPYEHTKENLKCKLQSESTETDVAIPPILTDIKRQYLACKRVYGLLIVICLEEKTDVILYALELGGKDHNPMSDNYKQFYLIQRMQINKHEEVEEDAKEEYIQKYEYYISIKFESVWITINSYGEARDDNSSKLLQIPNIIAFKPTLEVRENIKYEPTVIEKLYYLRTREYSWKFILTTEKLLVLENPSENKVAEYQNDYSLTKLMQVNYDEMKRQLKMLVAHKHTKPKSTFAVIVYSFLKNEWTFRFIENFKGYFGIVGFSKWYLTAFVIHKERFVSKKFPYNNYS